MLLESLFLKYLEDQLTAEELVQFRELALRPENRAELDRLLALWVGEEFPVGAHGAGIGGLEGVDVEALYFELTEKKNIPVGAAASGKVVRGRMGRRRWMAVAAAACLVVVVGGIKLLRTRPVVVAKVVKAAPVVIPAASSKAVLVLANGARIELDSAADGKLAKEGGTEIVKKGGMLDYRVGKDAAAGGASGGMNADGKIGAGMAAGGDSIAYNEIITPRGGYYELALPDGSKVWLNAASSLRYPTAFTGKTRTVELVGEAYFEVAPRPGQPFFIHSREVGVQVLGTSLNLMAYADEDAVRTTLVSGALRVVRGGDGGKGNGGDGLEIEPGEQVSWLRGGQSAGGQSRGGSQWKVSKPDMREVLAWKKGEFRFEGLSVGTIMRQIARWYDVDIEFRGPQPVNEFSGVIPRKKSVEELLAVLEETEEMHFTMEGRKIIVEAGGRSAGKK